MRYDTVPKLRACGGPAKLRLSWAHGTTGDLELRLHDQSFLLYVLCRACEKRSSNCTLIHKESGELF